MSVHRLLIFIAVFARIALCDLAAQMEAPINGPVRVCTGVESDHPAPSLDSGSCEKMSFWEIDPQGRELWIEANVNIPPELYEKPSLFVVISGKAASTLFLNGVRIGGNGAPGADAGAETPGQMDSTTPIPPNILKPGANTIIAHLSGHHSILFLRNPMHGLGVSAQANVTDIILRGYWPSLLTFGAFILGAIYFAVGVTLGPDRSGALLLALMSLFAAGQLFTEASRGLFAYTYPLHDVRLLLIVAFCAGFGMCLSALVARTFFPKRLKLIIAASAIVTLITVAAAPSYDGKAAFAVLIPTVIGVALSIVAAFRKRTAARRYAAALSIFAAIILLFPGQFLDVYFFYAIAGLLLFLFAQQAIALAREQALRRAESERARQLEQALAQAAERVEPEHIPVKNGGAIERIPTDKVLQFKGAGDYVAVDLIDGKQILHSGSLVEIEKILPPSFLRVHRSHIVNTAYVHSLKRKASGVGELKMTVGDAIPVSRRIMPKVRSALQ